jgi:hypothetical protein
MPENIVTNVSLLKLVETISEKMFYYYYFLKQQNVVRNNLECLSLASNSNLVECLRLRPQPTRVKHLRDAPL